MIDNFDYSINNENPNNLVYVFPTLEYKALGGNSLGMGYRNQVLLNSDFTGTNDNELVHHEFGHVLGVRHNPSGVMHPTLSSENKTISDNINDILGQAGIGINKSIQGGNGENNSLKLGQPREVKEIDIENKPEGFENGNVIERNVPE
jgi:hypothetical protein